MARTTLNLLSALLLALAAGACSERAASVFEPDRKYDGPCMIEVDHAYNGDVVDEREVFTYNDLGQLVVWEYDNGSYTDNFADGVLEQRITYTYYEDGKLATEEHDHVFGGTEPKTVDGIIDFRDVFFYDSKGNLEREERDEGEGTDLFWVHYYTYDEDALLVLIEKDWDPQDAVIDAWEIFDNDASGNLTTHDLAEGTIEAVYYRTLYAYDADGNKTLEEIDDLADETIDYRITYIYDADGAMIEQAVDGQGCMGFTPPDGVVDMRYLYTYDAAGNLSTMTIDGEPHDANGADGQPESLTTYAYDEFGNLLTEDFDRDVDGESNTVTTFTYDCWADIPLD